MEINTLIPGAEVIAFRPVRSGNIFTARDRLDILNWQAGGRDGIRLAIHQRDAGDPPEVGEFASVYLAGVNWAVWCAARLGRQIKVWRACDGRDLGWFETMQDVLALVGSWTAPVLVAAATSPCAGA